MFQTLILSLALAAQAPALPPQTTQLPPPVPPVPAPVVPVVEADTRPYVALVTDLGTITVRLEDKRAPVTAANFLRYGDTK
ncbi:peptidylprolyl isomerase, partial [Sphingopyxis sp.]|uniref:peptidylprolyl isomerase n=1 Tax=Sphingopyxis sp. TaxID=1908224 RepID=UPI002ED9EAA9